MTNQNIEEYNYSETLNLLTQARAERFRLIEAMTKDTASLKAIDRRIARLTKEAEAEAVRRGLETAEQEPASRRWSWLFAPVLVVAGFVGVNAFIATPVPMPITDIPTINAVRAIVEIPEAEASETTPEDTISAVCGSAYADLYADRMKEINVTSEMFYEICRKDLTAIATVESGIDPTKSKVDEIENSHGAFMINLNAHPDVTEEQAHDFGFATGYALDMLVKKGWPLHRTIALRAYNGAGPAAVAYAEKVKAIADKIK